MTAETIERLERAAQANDAQALLQLAVMRLAGDKISRDLPEARRLLALSRVNGSGDAALLEAALTANGTGGSPDWPAAIDILKSASEYDDVARQHLSLLDAMDLDADGNQLQPLELVQLSEQPDVRIAHNAFTAQEAAHIFLLAADILEPATVVDPQTLRSIPNPIRTSRNASIGPTRESLPLQAILRRIAALTKSDVNHGEPLTLLDYAPGQEYRPHHDALPGTANQRLTTALLYLNQGYAGGETHFIQNDLKISGQAGDIVFFGNTLADGRPDPSATHAGLPVTSGRKLIATRWIRAKPIDPWTMSGV